MQYGDANVYGSHVVITPARADPSRSVLVERVPAAVLVWPSTISAYKSPPQNRSAFAWEQGSQDVLTTIRNSLDEAWFARLATLWSQEGNRSNTSTDLRPENLAFIKILCM